MAADPSDDAQVECELFVRLGTLKGSNEAAGITAELEGIKGGAARRP
jgi:hypothetical protein